MSKWLIISHGGKPSSARAEDNDGISLDMEFCILSVGMWAKAIPGPLKAAMLDTKVATARLHTIPVGLCTERHDP